MIKYRSFLNQEIKDYLLYRRALGFKANGNLKSILYNFDKFLIFKNVNRDCLTPLFFLEMRKEMEVNPRTINKRISGIKGFFDFLIRKNYLTENPLLNIPPLNEHAYIPFITSVRLKKFKNF